MKISGQNEKRIPFLFLIIFLVLAAGITIVGYLHYIHYEKQYRTEIDNRLSAIASLKVNQIVQWRKERLIDAEGFHQNAEFSGLVKRFVNNQNDTDAKKRIKDWIEEVRSTSQYNRICLYDTNGVEVIFSPDKKILKPFIFSLRSSEVLKSGQIFFQDFYRDENDNNIYLTIFNPILSEQSGKNVIGVLALRIDPEQYLYPLINEWPTPSKTAETLLIRREGNEALFLNELKFQKNTALNLRRPLTELNLPAARAALGKKGIMEGVDYRGVPVIAYVCPIPNSPWFFVARINIAEVFAPIRERLWLMIFFIGALLFGYGAVIGFIWRHRRARFYREKYTTEKERTSLQEIISKSLNEIYVFDAGTLKFNYVNEGAIANLGYSMEELVKMTPLDIKPRFNINSFKEMVAPLYEKKIPVLLFETIHRRKDGSEYVVEVHLQLIDSEKGFVFLAIINDITERKLAEEALRESEERFRSLYENSPIGIYRTTPEGQILLANPTLVKKLGYSSFEELAARNLEKDGFEPTYERKQFLEDIEMNGEVKDLESAWTRKDGTIVYLCERAKAICDPNGKILYYDGTVEDITERKRAEEELQKNEKKFRELFDNAPIGYHELDLQGRIVRVNHTELDMLGYTKEEMIGQFVWKFVENEALSQQHVLEKLKGTHHPSQGAKSSYRRKDLTTFQVLLEEIILHDESNKIIGIRTTIQDITEHERVKEELIIAKERAEQSDKLKTEFLAQMSHEIRTPLNSIVGNVDYLNDLFDEGMDADTRDCFNGIGLASKRMIRTIDLILNVSELHISGYKPQFVKVDLNAEILNILYHEHQLSAKQKGLELIYKSEAKKSEIIADAYSITQILANLIDNAIKYTKKGKVEILLGKNKTGNIIVEVKDTGIGMSKEFLPKLFNPFVQEVQGYSRAYDGNGLGLALVQKYCEINNAIIEVESEKNVGSTFRVIFKN
jgi:PAS domain S-box-containing protein